nr:hypothetical protein [Mucilaginibacter sp. SP1R1]
MKRVIYNCKQATLLIEKKQVKSLTFRETIELRIHLAGCTFCKLYSKQSSMINKMVQQLYIDSIQTTPPTLTDDFKKELQERIEDELNKN